MASSSSVKLLLLPRGSFQSNETLEEAHLRAVIEVRDDGMSCLAALGDTDLNIATLWVYKG